MKTWTIMGHTELIIGRSDYTVTSWPMAKYSIYEDSIPSQIMFHQKRVVTWRGPRVQLLWWLTIFDNLSRFSIIKEAHHLTCPERFNWGRKFDPKQGLPSQSVLKRGNEAGNHGEQWHLSPSASDYKYTVTGRLVFLCVYLAHCEKLYPQARSQASSSSNKFLFVRYCS